MDTTFAPTLAPSFDATFAPSFETVAPPAVRRARHARLAGRVDPLTVGLSMVNWLVLMVLTSGFLLAATMSDRSEPAGTSSAITATK